MDFDPDDSRIARTARATRLRRMNDLVSERRDEFEGGAAAIHLLMCECPDQTCDTMLEVSRPELVDARTDDAWFVVHQEHVEGATVVRIGDGHAVVRYEAEGP